MLLCKGRSLEKIVPVNHVGMSVDVKGISMAETEVKGSLCVLESMGKRGNFPILELGD